MLAAQQGLEGEPLLLAAGERGQPASGDRRRACARRPCDVHSSQKASMVVAAQLAPLGQDVGVVDRRLRCRRARRAWPSRPSAAAAPRRRCGRVRPRPADRGPWCCRRTWPTSWRMNARWPSTLMVPVLATLVAADEPQQRGLAGTVGADEARRARRRRRGTTRRRAGWLRRGGASRGGSRRWRPREDNATRRHSAVTPISAVRYAHAARERCRSPVDRDALLRR